MRIGRKCLHLSLVLGTATAQGLLGAPPNDDFSAPTIVAGFPATATGSNVDATLEEGEPVPYDYGCRKSIWFQWTAPTSGAVQIDTLESDSDTVLGVWTNPPLTNLALVARNNDYAGTSQSAVFFDAASGTTYQIAVYDNGEQGAIALRITNDFLSRISGTVTGPGEAPLADIQASAYRWDASLEYWVRIADEFTGDHGAYVIGGLAAGTYRVQFDDWYGPYAHEVYSNAADLAAGTDIVLAGGETAAGIDASLAPAATISGTVTGPDGVTPLEGIDVESERWDGTDWAFGAGTGTAADGRYELDGLRAGTYRVRFYDFSYAYLAEMYDDIPWSGSWEGGKDLVLADGEIMAGIDATLAVAAGIEGRVTRMDGTTPLPDILVEAFRWNGSAWVWTSGAYTTADGSYRIEGLLPDTYRIGFRDYSKTYCNEIYNDVLGRVNWELGADVAVAQGATVTDIDAGLSLPATITGAATGPDGTTPLEGLYVRAYRRTGAGWNFAAGAAADSNGSYELSELGAGTYRVVFEDFYEDYVSEVYDDVPGLDHENGGLDIIVVEASPVAGIDARLAYANVATVGGIHLTAPGQFEILFTGTSSRNYILQEAAALTSEWTDVGAPTTAFSGTNTLPRSTSGPMNFWRVRLWP